MSAAAVGSIAPPLGDLGSPSSSVARSAADLPTWVMLEPFVFRRDDDESFPDDTKAIRASGITSWGARFRIAFTIAEPPHISRLYAQLPVPWFPPPGVSTPLSIVGTHRHLILFRLATQMYETQKDFFIYCADDPYSVKLLPPCNEAEPDFDYSLTDGRPYSSRRLLEVRSMGLWCPANDEFVVAELTLSPPTLSAPMSRSNVFADICFLRGNANIFFLNGNSQLVEGTWISNRVEIQGDDLWHLNDWETNTVIPFHKGLCWIDYREGILLCDMSKLPTPTISFHPLPKLPCPTRFYFADPFTDVPSEDCSTDVPLDDCFADNYSFLYRGACVVNHMLKFVNVTRHDGLAFGALRPGTGFTITCHTLMFLKEWKGDYEITSSQLWDVNHFLPRGMLMFPQVDMDRPSVVHFLLIEFGFVHKKMWVVSIDMSTKIVELFSPYINGKEDLKSDDADLVRAKSVCPMPFFPCEFPRFLSLSRKLRRMH